MQKNIIFALHGFLGQGDDWQSTENELTKHNLSVDWVKPNLFSVDSPDINPYETYVIKLIDQCKLLTSTYSKKVFLGYSLGGRLGLYILKHKPELFDHYCFVSTNPGLLSVSEKLERVKNDLQWQKQFQQQSWSDAVRLWNQQGVLQTEASEPKRELGAYDLDKLTNSLNLWSLGRQDDFRSLIKKHQNKVTWIVGTKDLKFTMIADELEEKKILLDSKRIFCGHRILFEKPTELALAIKKVL